MSDDRLAPVVKTLELPVWAPTAFRVLTTRIGEWWPLLGHSVSEDPGATVSIDLSPGGRVVERTPDGVEHVWGSVVELHPPRRIVLRWHPGRPPETAQTVEIEVRQLIDGSKLVLRHHGWEALGERAHATRSEYERGWDHVLGERYADAVKRP